MSFPYTLPIVALLGLGVAGDLPAAQDHVPMWRLDAADATYDAPFSRIFDVAELPDGHLVVTDPTEHTVSLVTPITRTPLGRQGQGPNEFRQPFSIVRLPGDTLAVYDAPNRRLFLVTPDGRPAGTRSLPPALISQGALSPPKRADGRGRLYFDRLALRVGDGSVPNRGSVVRWSMGAAVADSLVSLFLRDAEGRKVLRPFIARDGWDVMPDGTILLVRAADYHVEWIPPSGVPRVGPPVTTRPPAIDDAEIDAYIRGEGRTAAGAATMTADRPNDSPTTAARKAYRSDWVFPDRLPPFIADLALAAPSGEAWVVRTKAWDAPTYGVDIFDQHGRRIATMDLPPGRRLVALGIHGVYLAREDTDGLQWLERYPYPRD